MLRNVARYVRLTLAGRMMQLYTEISSKALENEKANQSK